MPSKITVEISITRTDREQAGDDIEQYNTQLSTMINACFKRQAVEYSLRVGHRAKGYIQGYSLTWSTSAYRFLADVKIGTTINSLDAVSVPLERIML